MLEVTERPVIRVEASRGWAPLNLRELWHYRGLLYFLAWRDIKVRYKQTTLGIAWAVLQPALTVFIFTIVFGRIMNVGNNVIPYPLLAMSGLLPWTFFEHALTDSAGSVVGNSNLISKVYFPRLIAPLAGVIGAFPDFIISFALLIVLLVFYHVTPGVAVVFLPFFVLLTVISALGVGVWFAALSAQFRDFRYILPFFMRFWLFASPVAYSSSKVTSEWARKAFGLNPMTGVIEGFRWALLGSPPPRAIVLLSTLVAVTVLVSGLFFFRRVERTFADLI